MSFHTHYSHLLLLLSLKADTHYTSCLSYPLWDLMRDVSVLLFGMLPLDHRESCMYIMSCFDGVFVFSVSSSGSSVY